MADTHPIIKTVKGLVRGKQVKTDDGFSYYSFQGIPYAKPPVGELRFKAPQPAENWEGVKDATDFGNVSIQLNEMLKTISGDEDCLFMNVFTPKLPEDGVKALPVMVHVHGGAFVVGAGNTDFGGPDYLIQEGVIMVSFNYRLGALGFLSLENKNISGNAGLKDQVAALRWVQENISAFGGDPSNVTIFGISAGGASVHYLLLSECTKGLFHKAISQSGCAFNPWAFQQNPKKLALRLCEVLGHKTDDVDEAYAFLKTAPAKDLVEGTHKLQSPKQCVDIDIVFVPNIENQYSEEEAFITEDPEVRILEGKFHQVPFMAGFTSEEGLFMISKVLHKSLTYDELNSDFEYVIPMNVPKDKSEQVWNKINKFYFNNKRITEENVIQLAHVKTDTDFIHGVIKMIKLQSKISKSSTYCYQFSFEEMGFGKAMVQTTLPGACHGDDMGFLLKINLMNLPIEKDSNIDITRRRMIKLWTNFAKFGNPTPVADELIPLLWEPVTDEVVNYLDINTDLTMRKNPIAERLSCLDDALNQIY